jgi:DNA-binding CsgD family transcriptional regulator
MVDVIKAVVLSGLFAILTSCGPYSSEARRMDAAFEQARLVYGEGENDTLLFIPELDKASAYYADKKDYGKAALAALYHGYAEMDSDKAEAMKAFSDAKQYGSLMNDSLTMARAQYQMGRMLYSDYMHEEALTMFRKAEEYYGSHYCEKALALNAEACLFILLQEYDNADSCLRKGQILADQVHSCEAKTKILNNFANLYQIREEYDKAIDCLKNVEPENEQQLLLNQLNLGSIFMAQGAMDSAEYYFSLVEKKLPTIETRKETQVAAYGSFSRFAESKGDYLSALRYRKTYDRLQFEVQQDLEQKIVYRIQKKYDYQAIENEIKVEKIHNLHNLLVFVILMLLSVIVIVFLLFLHKRLKRKEQDVELELDRVKQNLVRKVDINQVEKELLWRIQLILKTKSISDTNQPTKAKQLLVKQYILDGKESLYDAAKSVINEAYPELQSTLQSYYPNLSDTELKVCMLAIRGLSNHEIAKILDMSVHTINKCRSSLYKKMGVASDSFNDRITILKSNFQEE